MKRGERGKSLRPSDDELLHFALAESPMPAGRLHCGPQATVSYKTIQGCPIHPKQLGHLARAKELVGKVRVLDERPTAGRTHGPDAAGALAGVGEAKGGKAEPAKNVLRDRLAVMRARPAPRGHRHPPRRSWG